MRLRQKGFAYIAAIVVVVVLSMLGVAAVRMVTTQQSGAAQDELAARALQAARAGTEVGLQLANGQGICQNQVLNLSAEIGFWVTVTCRNALAPNQNFFEGQQTGGAAQPVRIFEIDAVACNVNGCPASAPQSTSPEYVERRRTVSTCIRPGPPITPC
ncbi:PilX N-terminal domain-containing pilus assembly protein [Pseudoduganella sp. UC29_106]|uniref:PilX N-terminal domain-containing pilus assembly protein n=1 Tax=Pseudoduganella sp. UC29_106 TaxID=3374553 RepID=UPI003756900E